VQTERGLRIHIAGLCLALFVGWVFHASPIHYLSDSRFSLLMDQALLEYGSPNMIQYNVPHGEGGGFTNHGYFWSMDLVKGRLLYTFPWGGALLSLPAVMLYRAFGIVPAPSGRYNGSTELTMQSLITAIVCALTVFIFYETAALFLPLRWALVIAVSAAFGTQMWSSASRSLWPQCWYVMLVALAIWILMSGRKAPLILGTLFAWACFTRPGAPAVVALITIYVWVEYDLSFFIRYALAGAVWTILFSAMMFYFEGVPFAIAYPLSYLAFRSDLGTRFFGVLLSPSRGLFVFSPILLLPVGLFVYYRRVLERRTLAAFSLGVILLHIIINSFYGPWWGGGSYGPRDLLDSIPWFVLLAIVGFRAFLDDRWLTLYGRWATISLGSLFLVVSIAINAAGALSPATIEWNLHPLIDEHPERLWDWEHPQFLAWAQQPTGP
jgi:hypothetical protein